MLCMLMMTACSEHIDIDHNQATDNEMCNVRLLIGTDNILPTTRAYTNSEMSIEKIKSYWLLFYKKNATGQFQLYKKEKGVLGAETSQQVETTINLESGTYHAYVVANIDYTKIEALSDNSEESSLFGMQMTWYDSDMTKNQTMFGFFTKADDKPGNDLVTDLDNKIDKAVNEQGLHKVNPTDYKYIPEIEINNDNIQAKLTAKLYRMAAMVSLHIDTWDLDPNVKIDLQSVKLCNIPTTYSLWAESKANSTGETNTLTKAVNYANASESEIEYTSNRHGTDYPWIRRYYVGNIDRYHSDNVHTLNRYFYLPENRQGTVETTSLNDKTAGAGKAKEYATYIEVVAKHKINDTNERTVTYRYALGEDSYGDNNEIVYNNYNVTRNRHYKVYLTLKGYGLSSAATWRTELGSETFTPFIEVTGNKIRLVDQYGDTYSSSSDWNATASGQWVNLRTSQAVASQSDFSFANTINGTGAVEFYFHSEDDNTIADDDCTITITYDTDKSVAVTLKRQRTIQFQKEGGSWVQPSKVGNYGSNLYKRHYSTNGDGNIPVYYNMFISDTPCSSGIEVFKLNVFHGITEEVKDNEANSYEKNFEFRWSGSIAHSKNNHNKTDDNKYNGVVTIFMKSYIRLNGYYTFDIHSKGYLPEHVTLLKNAPVNVENISDSIHFTSGVNIPEVSNISTGSTTDDDYKSMTSPQVLKNKGVTYDKAMLLNDNNYIDIRASKGKTIKIVALGTGETNKLDIYNTDKNELCYTFDCKNEYHIRQYSYKTNEDGNYRIKLNEGYVYVYYVAM